MLRLSLFYIIAQDLSQLCFLVILDNSLILHHVFVIDVISCLRCFATVLIVIGCCATCCIMMFRLLVSVTHCHKGVSRWTSLIFEDLSNRILV